MLDIKNGIRSLSEFKQNSTDILRYIKKTHSPAILTINGKAEAVLIDTESYQEMINKIALLESGNRIKSALVEMENDEGIPAEKAFKKLRKKIIKK
ncbi:MAG: type II toxin-antitoxin system prevent-host-death family antitoxin [Rickettsiales bacterium]|nr:type II toxin-antitoxin system prevent-host-death family antitoxin [Rickettsiales bacterium]